MPKSRVLVLCTGAVEERSSRVEVSPKGGVERGEVRMLELVAIIPVGIRDTERARFPEPC